MEITYNADDRIHEVRIPRRSFNALIVNAVDMAYTTIGADIRTGLVKLAREGKQVLANTTKLEAAHCGCPAIMAQVDMGKSYEASDLGDNVGRFPGQFDQNVRNYMRGLLDSGAEAADGSVMTYHESDRIRLIAVD